MKFQKFESFDKTIIQSYLWDEVRSPKGVVQIVHGMAEHAKRYDAFAQYLNKNGYIVWADDHRAHGATEPETSIGYHEGNIYLDSVKDEIAMTKYLKETYKLPVVLVGHSYGSFLSQRYIEMYSDIAGVIFSGTAYMKGMILNMGAAIANIQHAFLGGKKKGKFIDKLSFGSYNKPFKKEAPEFGWLTSDVEQVKKYVFDKHCGYVMSIGFYKHFFNGLKKAYDKANLNAIPKSLPIAIFSGSCDPVGGNGKLVEKLYKQYQDLKIENVSMKLYKNGRHEILNETNYAEVFKDFLDKIDGFVQGKADTKTQTMTKAFNAEDEENAK